ncbi:MAG TPA: SDR family oxidoreductase [Solirubrobacterales bacterium]|nr:SDR family oxidoreductase [Solirubrobacterales bacterium]
MPPREPVSDADKPVLLITGASSGIGAATARLAADRYRLVLAARRQEALEGLAAELGGPEAALAVGCDVTRWDQVESLAARALAEFGRIDAVFANAGFGATRGFLEESPEHWESMVLANVLGPALTIRATLPHLLERGDGHYLITSSVAGRRPLPGSLYSATKFAATTIGEALRMELRQEHKNERIKVTLVEPGIVDTEFFDDKPAEWALRDEDIAREVLHALSTPPGVEINEILIRPTAQRG